MHRARFLVLLVVVSAVGGCEPCGDNAPVVKMATAAKQVQVGHEDRELFEAVYRLGLLDPRGLQRVRGNVEVPTCWGRNHVAEASGWLRGGKVFLDNLREARAPVSHVRVELADETRAALDSKEGEKGELPLPDFGGDESMAPFNTKLRYVFWAAWLYRRGALSLASELMARIRKETPEWEVNAPLLEAVEFEIAAEEFNQAMLAFMAGADDVALAHAERFVKMKPAEDYEEFGEGRKLLEELKRRKTSGTFGKSASNPKGKSIAELIQDLELVFSRQWGQPGGVSFHDNPIVLELVAKGDEAVPPLLDCIEKDRRYTRSIGFHRDFSAFRHLIEVEEPARNALLGILSVKELAFYDLPDLRNYWKTYGPLPFADRMLEMMRDRSLRPETLRECARNLAFDRRELALWGIDWIPRRDSAPHPAIARFKDPTAAEAIVRCLQRDPKGLRDYLSALVELNDVRILPEMVRRYQAATTPADRASIAQAAFQLGDPAPLRAVAEVLESGKTANEDVVHVTGILCDADDAACDRALNSLTRPDHPNHECIKGILLDPSSFVWWDHPFCLRIMRLLLDDEHPTGTEWSIEGEELVHTPAMAERDPIPAILKNPADRISKRSERRLDRIMLLMNYHLWGRPEYHPLLRTADEHVAAARRLLDQSPCRYRKLSREEYDESQAGIAVMVPDIRPLDRPATAEDVAQGRAIFHLDGKGKARKLDRHGAFLKGTYTPVILLQAEESATGETCYGVVGRNLIGMKTAAELDFTVPK